MKTMKTKLFGALIVGFVIGAGTFFLVPPPQETKAQGQLLWGDQTAQCVLTFAKNSGSGNVILSACRRIWRDK